MLAKSSTSATATKMALSQPVSDQVRVGQAFKGPSLQRPYKGQAFKGLSKAFKGLCKAL